MQEGKKLTKMERLKIEDSAKYAQVLERQKESKKRSMAKYRQNHQEKFNIAFKKWYEANKELHTERCRISKEKYLIKHAEEIQAKKLQKEQEKEAKEELTKQNRLAKRKTPEYKAYVNKSCTKYYHAHREERLQYLKEYRLRKSQEDPNWREKYYKKGN